MEFDVAAYLREHPISVSLQDAADIAEKKGEEDEKSIVSVTAVQALRELNDALGHTLCNPFELTRTQIEAISIIEMTLDAFPELREPLFHSIISAISESAAGSLIFPLLARMTHSVERNFGQQMSESIDAASTKIRDLLMQKLQS